MLSGPSAGRARSLGLDPDFGLAESSNLNCASTSRGSGVPQKLEQVLIACLSHVTILLLVVNRSCASYCLGSRRSSSQEHGHGDKVDAMQTYMIEGQFQARMLLTAGYIMLD